MKYPTCGQAKCSVRQRYTAEAPTICSLLRHEQNDRQMGLHEGSEKDSRFCVSVGLARRRSTRASTNAIFAGFDASGATHRAFNYANFLELEIVCDLRASHACRSATKLSPCIGARRKKGANDEAEASISWTQGEDVILGLLMIRKSEAEKEVSL